MPCFVYTLLHHCTHSNRGVSPNSYWEVWVEELQHWDGRRAIRGAALSDRLGMSFPSSCCSRVAIGHCKRLDPIITSSFSKTFVFARPHVNTKTTKKNLHFESVFENLRFRLPKTPFTRGRKGKTKENVSIFKNIRIRVDEASQCNISPYFYAIDWPE